ncbi:MAG: MmgE/PrpD family protein, partial [Alphaproteobacteria bacterium]|nr:MmgE/PrpD family protein [Alphaproteobacteria bacterium]
MATENLTRTLASKSAALEFDAIPAEAHELARQCVLDYYGVALAGVGDELVQLLLDELAEAGGAPQASVIGHPARLPALSAALVNGAASHALDYDDVNMAMPGH